MKFSLFFDKIEENCNKRLKNQQCGDEMLRKMQKIIKYTKPRALRNYFLKS